MQFKVPQFLEIEDKIFGPFTFKQFVYLAGGAGLCFVLFKMLGFLLGAIPILLVAGIAASLAFYRPNSKPLVEMLEAGFKYALQNKLYIWKRRKLKAGDKKKTADIKKEETQELENLNTQKLGRSRLKDLSWSLDVLDLKKNDF